MWRNIRSRYINFFTFFICTAILGAAGRAESLPPAGAIPPYELKADLGVLTYSVPTAILRKWIPQPLALASFGGVSPLVVLAAHYTYGRSVATGFEGQLYDEISYATLVSKGGRLGGYFLSLHLDSAEAQAIGRIQYGFPKDLAVMSYAGGQHSYFMAAQQPSTDVSPAGELLESLDLNLLDGVIDRAWGGATAVASRLVSKIFEGTYFIRGRELVWADMKLNLSTKNAFPASISHVDLPFAVKKGWITGVQANHPWVALVYRDAWLQLGEPQVLQPVP